METKGVKMSDRFEYRISDICFFRASLDLDAVVLAELQEDVS